MTNELNKQKQGDILSFYGIIISLFSHNESKGFVKNANSTDSLWLGLLSPFCLSLFGDNRGLRFMCVGFG